MRILRFDLHCHLKPAKRLPYVAGDAERVAAAARVHGLDGVAVTEHARGTGYWATFDALASRHPLVRGRFEVDGVLLLPGMEVTLGEHVDVLLIGDLDELRRLDGAFRPRLTEGLRPGAPELISVMAEVKPRLLRVAPHPYLRTKRAEKLGAVAISELFHAMELNATLAGAHDTSRVLGMARRHEVGLTGGSDAHAWPQVGAAWTEVYASGDSMDSVIDAVIRRRCEARVHPDAAALVAAGAAMKKRLKAQRKAGILVDPEETAVMPPLEALRMAG